VNQRQVLLVQVRPELRPEHLIQVRLRQLLLLLLVPVVRQGLLLVLRHRLRNQQQMQVALP